MNLKNDYTQLKNGLAYVLFAEGIPIVYYGTEQGFAGGNDPANREDLWRSNFNRNHELYQFISRLAKFRATLPASYFTSEQIERYVDDQFFAYTRDKVFVALTNIGCCGSVTRHITYHPYAEGTVLVNMLDTSDRLIVRSAAFDVTMTQGLPKVYYPSTTFDATTPDAPEAAGGSAATAVIVAGSVFAVGLAAAMAVVLFRQRRQGRAVSETTSLLPATTQTTVL